MIKLRPMLLAMVVLGLVGLVGCSMPSFLASAPTDIAGPTMTLRPTFTSTPPRTNTPLPTDTPTLTATPLPTDTALPTDTPQPTPTPVPPTDTPLPPTVTSEGPTETPGPPTATTAPPRPTSPPARPTQAPPTATPAPQPKHVVGAHGVSGLVVARDKTTFAVGERAFFTYEALNHTKDPVGFELLGIKASNGQFNTSWINPDVIQPGEPFKHDDGLTFNQAGTYKVMLAICFARCDQADADWEEFPHGAVTITVK